MIAAARRTAALRIMLVDDHPVVRRGVRDILTDAFPGICIEDVSLGADAVPLLLRGPSWDVVILDLSLPDCSGMEVLERIRRLKADLPVLILSMHSADQFARRAYVAGAAGYLTKDAVDTELVVAVTDALGGRRYFPDGHEPETVAAQSTEAPPHVRLSARELQVLVALAQGKTVGDIARELNVTSKTVSTFRTRLLRKMELRTNADITKYVIQHRLMP
jgi:two-component system invasion response regulator UvrY